MKETRKLRNSAFIIVLALIGASSAPAATVCDLASTPSQKCGYVSVRCVPAADVILVGNGVEEHWSTPVSRRRIPAGTYAVSLVNSVLGLEKKITISVIEDRFVYIDEHLLPPNAPSAAPTPDRNRAPVAQEVSPKRPKVGYVSIRATPAAEAILVVDGVEEHWPTPVSRRRLPVGTYAVKLVNAPLGLEKKITLTIEEDRFTLIDERLAPANLPSTAPHGAPTPDASPSGPPPPPM
jgi:hypothetical protein